MFECLREIQIPNRTCKSVADSTCSIKTTTFFQVVLVKSWHQLLKNQTNTAKTETFKSVTGIQKGSVKKCTEQQLSEFITAH